MFKFKPSLAKAILFCLVSGAVFAPSALARQADFSIKSEILQQTREIAVHLPKNYDPDSKVGYPVLYMLDGDHETDEIAAKTAGEYHAALMTPDVIVIAIHNINRGMDFLPHYYSVKPDGKEVFGNGGKFLAFIEDELIPFVSKKFRTNDRRVFAGHSWAGQFAAYALSQSPELFDAYFITSPVFDEYGDQTFSALERVFKQDLDFPSFIYVSSGSTERPSYRSDFERLNTLFKQQLPKQVKWHSETNEGANHDDNADISIASALKLYFSTTP